MVGFRYGRGILRRTDWGIEPEGRTALLGLIHVLERVLFELWVGQPVLIGTILHRYPLPKGQGAATTSSGEPAARAFPRQDFGQGSSVGGHPLLDTHPLIRRLWHSEQRLVSPHRGLLGRTDCPAV